MRVVLTGLFLMALTACGAAEFSQTNSSSKALAAGDANGVISQDVINMCQEAGMVPKSSDCSSDDDSKSVDSTDDDSVDGVSADNASSDDDSSDDKACSSLESCIKKKCQPAPPAPAPAPAPAP